MKATTQVEAIPEPMEMLVQERKGHEFTPNALTVPTAEVAAEKTKERSVPKDLEPTCKPAQHHNKGNTALVTTITTTKVAAISNAAVTTTTTAADTNSDKRAVIVHVITTHKRAKAATNSAPITNLGKRAVTVHAKKAATKLTKKVVISSVPTISHAKKAAIVHVTTTRKAATNNAAATSNAAVTNKATIANARPTTIQMQNTA